MWADGCGVDECGLVDVDGCGGVGGCGGCESRQMGVVWVWMGVGCWV